MKHLPLIFMFLVGCAMPTINRYVVVAGSLHSLVKSSQQAIEEAALASGRKVIEGCAERGESCAREAVAAVERFRTAETIHGILAASVDSFTGVVLTLAISDDPDYMDALRLLGNVADIYEELRLLLFHFFNVEIPQLTEVVMNLLSEVDL